MKPPGHPTFLKKLGWLAVRVLLLTVSLLVSYLGFVTFFFVGVLFVLSCEVGLFSGDGLNPAFTAVLFVYLVPLDEMILSLSIEIVTQFFQGFAQLLNVRLIGRTLLKQFEGRRSVVVFRLLWAVFYFSVLLSLFLFCLFGSDLPFTQGIRVVFSFICVAVPLVMLLRPLVVAWALLLLPCVEREGEAGVIEEVTKHGTLRLYDSVGLLQRTTWESFLRSELTAHARPRRKPTTWIATISAVAMLITWFVLVMVRQLRLVADATEFTTQVWDQLNASAALWGVALPDYEPPAFWTIGITIFHFLFMTALFPVVVLSHHLQLFINWSALKERKQVRNAKIIGFVVLVLAFVLVIFGLLLSALRKSDVSRITEIPDSRTTLVFADEDSPAICRVRSPEWTLTQLAALPVLAEAKHLNMTGLFDYVARLAEVPIGREPLGSIDTPTVIAFDDKTGQLAMAMPALEPRLDLVLLVENAIGYWYGSIAASVIPFYGTAKQFFLSDIIASTSNLLIGVSQLAGATTATSASPARLTLALSSEVLGVLRMAAQSKRATIVGHSANGLLVKGLAFDHDPWRVSFAAPSFVDSAMIAQFDPTGGNAAKSYEINMFEEGSIYAPPDSASAQNLQLPAGSPTRILPPGPLENLCIVAASCDPDDRFAALCAKVMKDGVFEDIQAGLGRSPFKTTKTDDE